MAQFYFLSILFNVAAGLILVYGAKLSEINRTDVKEIQVKDTAKKGSKKSSKKGNASAKESKSAEENLPAEKLGSFKNAPFLNDRTMRLVIGMFSGFVGIMKLLTVFKGDVPVIGDLFPALAGLLAGASLILEYYMNTTTEPVSIPEPAVAILVDARKYVGLLCLLVAVLHFIFPGVLLL